MPFWRSLVPHLQGHVLRFDAAPLETYPPAGGRRLLLSVALVEGVLGPRLHLLRLLGLPPAPAWLRVALLLALVLALVRWFAGLRAAQIGLRAWASWSLTEKSYCIQVFVLANLVFATLFARPLAALMNDPALWAPGAIVLSTSLLWGFYQELVYRGLLQTELCRRWGATVGILVANTLFTFGPLHFYHFLGRSPSAAAGMFAGIFAIGLFFGVLFKRSNNLWMVGLFHGLGDAYITGLAGLN